LGGTSLAGSTVQDTPAEEFNENVASGAGSPTSGVEDMCMALSLSARYVESHYGRRAIASESVLVPSIGKESISLVIVPLTLERFSGELITGDPG